MYVFIIIILFIVIRYCIKRHINISDSEKRAELKRVFTTSVLPAFYSQGFEKSPFSGSTLSWSIEGYYSDLARLRGDELVLVHIYFNTRIDISLGCYRLAPMPLGLSDLHGLDYSGYWPFRHSFTRSMPVSLGYYITRRGLRNRADRIAAKLTASIGNIDNIISKIPCKPTDWNGHEIKEDTDTAALPVPKKLKLYIGRLSMSELNRLSNRVRRNVSAEHGFSQRDQYNWTIKDGYIFYLDCYVLNWCTLTVKPIYADCLWYEIKGEPIPQSRSCSWHILNGDLPFGQNIGDYNDGDICDDIYNVDSEELMEKIWRRIFDWADEQIGSFLQTNPDADLFIADKSHIIFNPLLYYLTLIHNNRIDSAYSELRELKKAKGLNQDLSFLLRWCRRFRSKSATRIQGE